MTPKLKIGLLVAGAAVLVAAGVAGWVRKPVSAAAPYNTATPYTSATNPEPVAPASAPTANNGYDQYGQPRYAQDAYSPSGVHQPVQPEPIATTAAGYSSGTGCEYPAGPLPAYATHRYVRTVHARVESPQFVAEGGYVGGPPYGYATGYYAAAPAPAYQTRRTEYYYVHGHRHHRSVGKSVAIVAGSAGVGAAIGGIAGGGKGAGIGALAGGAGGFIYDRLTRNHH